MKEYPLKALETPYPRIAVSEEFVKRNNLKLLFQDELLARWKEVTDEVTGNLADFFDFRQEVLINLLSYANAKEFLKEEAQAEYESGKQTWETIEDTYEVAQDFLDYMQFAWGKAMDERGISAARSISKLGEWLYVLGRKDLSELIHDFNYNPYGAPALIEVCKQLGIEVPGELEEFAKHPC